MRAVKGQEHRCSTCGKTGHRLETCPSAAAKTIRKLKAELKKKVHFKKKPTQGPRSSGAYKKVQSMKYTKKTTQPRLKKARRQSAWGEGGRRHDVIPLLDHRAGLARLQQTGFADPKPTHCPACGTWGSLANPAPNPQNNKGCLYYRCTMYSCNTLASYRWPPRAMRTLTASAHRARMMWLVTAVVARSK